MATKKLLVSSLCVLGAMASSCAPVDEVDEAVGAATGELSHSQLVSQVRTIITNEGLQPVPPLPIPDVEDDIYDLGRRLSFDKVLSGTEDVACLTCHHPQTETDDNRALPLGVHGDGLGLDRVGGTIVPRNAPALFNLHTIPALFWDSRARIDDNGDYITPLNSVLPDQAPPELGGGPMADVFRGLGGAAGSGVVGFQAMFPVTSRSEMRGPVEQSSMGNMPDPMEGGASAGPIWAMLMFKLGAIPEYVQRFEDSYPGTPFQSMNFAHAANAIGVYQMVAFKSTGSPWEQFLQGDDSALSKKQLRGAVKFFENDCNSCHSGSTFSDFEHHNIGLPQFGPGKGNGPNGDDDFGREFITHDSADRYQWRTPPFYNVELTGPYGHAGQYKELEDIVEHYHDVEDSLLSYDIEENVDARESYLWDTQIPNQQEVLALVGQDVIDIDFGNKKKDVKKTTKDITAFLKAFTDPTLDLTTPETVPSGLPVDGIEDNIGSSVKFTEVAGDLGMNFERTASPRNASSNFLRQLGTIGLMDIAIGAQKGRGVPGIAIFDYDNDGDEDIYVSNGPGSANSLYQNQLVETGTLGFIDSAVAAGADATAQDSAGVCAGDIDNDGDDDLVVLGVNEQNILYRNDGGTFTDISQLGDFGSDSLGSMSCSIGDVDNDGLVDILIANMYSGCINVVPPLGEQCGMEHSFPIFVEPYALNDHNQLFINQGGGVFNDESAARGLENTTGFVPPADGSPTVTWAIALVDVDQDGDLDIVQADDQAAIPNFAQGGVDRGILHIFDNDGTGNYTDISVASGVNKDGSWMGLAFGDLNCDGEMDMFGSNLGDYMFNLINPGYQRGHLPSRWFLRNPDGTYDDPGVGNLVAGVFGWGANIFDYDNDGDQDIVYHGGLDVFMFSEASNPGAILENQGCSAEFRNATRKTGSDTNHLRRTVEGFATGDLNNDGFPDMVSASGYNAQESIPLTPAYAPIGYGSTFDGGGVFFRFQPNGDGTFTNDPSVNFENGNLSVEMSSGNDNGWVKVRTVGSVGITPGATVNRGGIGAVVKVTPKDGMPSLKPVIAGASYASMHSANLTFGLGEAKKATIDVLWPGGVRNRLVKVKDGKSIRMVEIPCSIDDQTISFQTYKWCVNEALGDLKQAGLISNKEKSALKKGAIKGWQDEH
jgi:enediyne biosynthesis protein E4